MLLLWDSQKKKPKPPQNQFKTSSKTRYEIKLGQNHPKPRKPNPLLVSTAALPRRRASLLVWELQPGIPSSGICISRLLALLRGRGAASPADRPSAKLATAWGSCSQPACLYPGHAHTWRHYSELWLWWSYFLYGWHPDLLAYSCGFPWSAVMAYYLSICLQAWVTFNFFWSLMLGKQNRFRLVRFTSLDVGIYGV